jgi:hypothetical protein
MAKLKAGNYGSIHVSVSINCKVCIAYCLVAFHKIVHIYLLFIGLKAVVFLLKIELVKNLEDVLLFLFLYILKYYKKEGDGTI